jgi:ubiquinone/menaquinone biosynthesis C-methylase UbiE
MIGGDGLAVPYREKVARAYATHLQRTSVYLARGYDRQGTSRFIVDQAGTGDGPVLDVGTGKGIQALALAHAGLDVVTVDLDAEAQRHAGLVAEAEHVRGRIRFVRADGRSLPFRGEAFDVVYLVDALHHLEDGDPVFAEMARVVRRSAGRIVLAEFSDEGFAIIAGVHRSEGRVHQAGPVTLESALESFRRRGFHVRSMTEQFVHRVAVLTAS